MHTVLLSKILDIRFEKEDKIFHWLELTTTADIRMVSSFEEKEFIESNANMVKEVKKFVHDFKSNMLEEKEKYELNKQKWTTRLGELQMAQEELQTTYDQAKESMWMFR